jgi:hypothetical protein
MICIVSRKNINFSSSSQITEKNHVENDDWQIKRFVRHRKERTHMHERTKKIGRSSIRWVWLHPKFPRRYEKKEGDEWLEEMMMILEFLVINHWHFKVHYNYLPTHCTTGNSIMKATFYFIVVWSHKKYFDRSNEISSSKKANRACKHHAY